MSNETKHYLEAELEEQFHTNNNMWSFLQEGSLDGVWYWDLEHPEHEWMSPEMWRLLGIDPATKRHDPAEWQDLIFEEDLKAALENFEKHCADPNHPYDQIVRYRHADGSTVWVRCRGIAIRDEKGKPLRMLGAHNDYTPIKRAEEAAILSQREIIAANEELRSFAYSTSHDLKSPSNTVAMVLREAIEVDQGGLSTDQHDLLQIALRTIDNMCTTIEGLLTYTRLIGQELQWEQVSLTRIFTEIEEDLAAAITEAGGTLVVEPLPEVPVHRVQIRVLFQNLVENALKFRHPDRRPVITVGSRPGEASDSVQIDVSDNGQGIAAKHEDRIFELFKRLHRADQVEGAGLGLTLCRRIAINHGGDIQVSSEPGKGSTFRVTLPGTRL